MLKHDSTLVEPCWAMLNHVERGWTILSWSLLQNLVQRYWATDVQAVVWWSQVDDNPITVITAAPPGGLKLHLLWVLKWEPSTATLALQENLFPAKLPGISPAVSRAKTASWKLQVISAPHADLFGDNILLFSFLLEAAFHDDSLPSGIMRWTHGVDEPGIPNKGWSWFNSGQEKSLVINHPAILN